MELVTKALSQGPEPRKSHEIFLIGRFRNKTLKRRGTEEAEVNLEPHELHEKDLGYQ
jgi:hypothetical protein